MNILQSQNNKKKQLIDLYLPKEVDIAVNLIHTFIKNIGKDMTNILGLKLAIILSGARSQIKYDKDNRVKFEVDELCNICKINRRQLSSQIKRVIATSYHFIDINGDIVGTTPIHTYRYTRDNKHIFISVSQEAKRLFGELGKGGYRFTQALTNNLFNLKHKHSLRMQLFLEMINKYNNNINKKVEMNLEEINGYFGTGYKRFVDIERKILIPVQNEITNSSTLTFKYHFEDIVSGGRPKIDKIVIDLVENKNSSEPTEKYTPIQDINKNDFTKLYDNIIDLKLHKEYDISIENSSLIKIFYKYIKEQVVVFKDYCKENEKNYKNITTSFKRHIRGAFNNNLDFFSSSEFLYRKEQEHLINETKQNKKIEDFLVKYNGTKLCEMVLNDESNEIEEIYVINNELNVLSDKKFLRISSKETILKIINIIIKG